MNYYNKCTVRFSTGREVSFENFSGKAEYQWRKYLKESGYDLRYIYLFFSHPVVPQDKLTAIPRKIGG